MGFTPNGAPIVGPVEGLEGQYIAAGFTGHGMPRAYAVYVRPCSIVHEERIDRYLKS